MFVLEIFKSKLAEVALPKTGEAVKTKSRLSDGIGVVVAVGSGLRVVESSVVDDAG